MKYDLEGICQDCIYLEKIKPLFESKDKEIDRLNNDYRILKELQMKANEENNNLQQKVEQLENIRKEAIEYINHAQNYGTMAQVMPHLKPYINGDDLLNILNKGSDK